MYIHLAINTEVALIHNPTVTFPSVLSDAIQGTHSKGLIISIYVL